mgnify:CR=1 FL=1
MTPQQRKESKIEREKRNLDTFRSASFIEACKRAKIEPTTRQASKFARRIGLAYNTP